MCVCVCVLACTRLNVVSWVWNTLQAVKTLMEVLLVQFPLILGNKLFSPFLSWESQTLSLILVLLDLVCVQHQGPCTDWHRCWACSHSFDRRKTRVMHRNVCSVKASDWILWSRNCPLPYSCTGARSGHPTWQLLSTPNQISTMFAPILLKNKGWTDIFPICHFTCT